MFAENLSVFFSTDEHAIACAYDAAGVNTTINVIFDRAYITQLTGMMAGTNPAALVITSQVAANPCGKTLTVNGATYTIREFEPQDDGALTLLQLEAP